MSDLVKRLWESDAASALTNEAARRIEKLESDNETLFVDILRENSRAMIAEARVRKLERALTEISETPDVDADMCCVIAKRAMEL